MSQKLPWITAQDISTHWLRHTTLTWVERHFGYGIARAYAEVAPVRRTHRVWQASDVTCATCTGLNRDGRPERARSISPAKPSAANRPRQTRTVSTVTPSSISTSDLKTGKIMVSLSPHIKHRRRQLTRPVRILNVTGMRAEESHRRRNLTPYAVAKASLHADQSGGVGMFDEVERDLAVVENSTASPARRMQTTDCLRPAIRIERRNGGEVPAILQPPRLVTEHTSSKRTAARIILQHQSLLRSSRRRRRHQDRAGGAQL